MTRKQEVQTFKVSGLDVRVTDCPRRGVTVAFLTGSEGLPERRRTLFTGRLESGTTSQLHRLAAHLSTKEERIST